MSVFKKAVAAKSTEELKWITENPKDFQDEFLIAVQEEMVQRNVDIESPLFEKKIDRLEARKVEADKSRKALDEQLPNTIKLAANLIYLGLTARILNVFHVTFTIEIAVGEFSYLNLIGGFLLMIYVAAVIKKGHDIRKLLLIIVIFNSFSFLFAGLFLLSNGISMTFLITTLSFMSELVAIVLLYHDDSREWYSNLKD